MTRKWSIKSRTSSLIPKPLRNSTIQKIIAKSITYIVLSKKRKKGKKTESECIFDTDEAYFSQSAEDTKILSHADEMSSDNIAKDVQELKKPITLHKSVSKCQAKEERIKNIYYFVIFQHGNIIKDYQEKSSSMYETNKKIVSVEIGKNEKENLKCFFEYINEFKEYICSGMSTKIKKSSLISLLNVNNNYPEYYIDYDEYIKHLNIQINYKENLIFLNCSLELSSQNKIDSLDTKISSEYFIDVEEIKNESSSDIQIGPLVVSVDNTLYDINNNNLCLSQNEHIGCLPVSQSTIHDIISEDKIESLSHKSIEIERKKNMHNESVNINFDRNTEQLDNINNIDETNFPQLISKTPILESVFKYIHGISSPPTKNKSQKVTLCRRLSSIKRNSSDEKYSNTLSTTKSSIEDIMSQLNNTSLIYAPFSISSIASSPSFYIKDNDCSYLDATRVKNSIIELREEIKKLSILEEKLTLYYEFLLDQQSSV
uniref:GRIP domain-containing protein n=1 Tax=Strongyloides papillosus TaxID=174720 RepID=A0A0N5BNQ5_STREA